MENWVHLDGYDYDYYVSSLGNVRKGDRLLKQSNSSGYKVVGLRKDGKSIQHKVHRVVAMAFIPNPENLPCINHKDEDKANNRVENLEWCTMLYNNTYGSRPDKIRASNSRRGCSLTVRQKICKTLTALQGKGVAQVTIDGDVINAFSSTKEAERVTGVPHNKISSICLGKSKHYKQTYWKYV